MRARGRISREDGSTGRYAPRLRKCDARREKKGRGEQDTRLIASLPILLIYIYTLLLFALGHAVLGRLGQGGARDGVVVWRIAF